MFRTEKHSYLFADIHHLLMDGGSLSVLFSNIVSAYFGRKLELEYLKEIYDKKNIFQFRDNYVRIL